MVQDGIVAWESDHKLTVPRTRRYVREGNDLIDIQVAIRAYSRRSDLIIINDTLNELATTYRSCRTSPLLGMEVSSQHNSGSSCWANLARGIEESSGGRWCNQLCLDELGHAGPARRLRDQSLEGTGRWLRIGNA